MHIRIKTHNGVVGAALRNFILSYPMSASLRHMAAWQFDRVYAFCRTHNWSIEIVDDCRTSPIQKVPALRKR